MACNVLRNLHADDYVIVLDTTFETAGLLANGKATFGHANDPNSLDEYCGDRIRAANYDDTMRVVTDIIFPLFRGSAE